MVPNRAKPFIFSKLVVLLVFSPNTGKCGPEETPYLSTFHAVHIFHDQKELAFLLLNFASCNYFRRTVENSHRHVFSVLILFFP